MLIGEIARQAGLRPSAIRYYESIGVLPRPDRVSGQRRYDPSVQTLLQLIQAGKSAGFTIAEIKTLFHGFAPDVPPSKRWQALARQKLVELDAIIARAVEMKRVLELGLTCRCLRLEDCVFGQ
jgi:MerR family redox-sensitive transcriptional activator SoxR